MTTIRTCVFAGLASLALAVPGGVQAQQAPNPQDVLNQLGLGQMGAGMTGLPVLEVQGGTWVYPVRAGLHVAMLGGLEIGADNGIDGDALARGSLRAVYIAAGDPPTCPGSNRADMRGRSSIIAMTVETGSGPFLGGDQKSRLVVNQALNHAVLYLHGEASEWIPGSSFCDDGNYVLAGSGRGFLRMEYETTAHVVPLNFMAFPRAGDVDPVALEDACRRMQELVLEAYSEMNRRWDTISTSYDGPVDWSVITPAPEGYGDGEHASFADGLFNSGDVVQAAASASDLSGLILNLGNAFSAAPSVMVAGANGAAQWAMMHVVEAALDYADIPMVDPIDAMMAMAQMGHSAFQNSGDPVHRQVADHALQRLPDANGPFEGIDADYLINNMLQACEQPAEEAPAGIASGHFSWPGGTVPLSGIGLMPGQPAATAAAPVGVTSLSDALSMAQALGAEVPSQKELQAQLPPGLSLDTLPAPMSGQAGGGVLIQPNAPEWTLSYTVELVNAGEQIAADWFDPRR